MPPASGMFGFGGPQNSAIAIAADVLEMDRADLIAELQSGKTVADVASEQGVALQTIVDAIMAPRQEHLAEVVEAGQLTQEEADELLATMEENITTRLSEPWSPMGYGPGAGPGFVFKWKPRRSAPLGRLATGARRISLTSSIASGGSNARAPGNMVGLGWV